MNEVGWLGLKRGVALGWGKMGKPEGIRQSLLWTNSFEKAISCFVGCWWDQVEGLCTVGCRSSEVRQSTVKFGLAFTNKSLYTVRLLIFLCNITTELKRLWTIFCFMYPWARLKVICQLEGMVQLEIQGRTWSTTIPRDQGYIWPVHLQPVIKHQDSWCQSVLGLFEVDSLRVVGVELWFDCVCIELFNKMYRI